MTVAILAQAALFVFFTLSLACKYPFVGEPMTSKMIPVYGPNAVPEASHGMQLYFMDADRDMADGSQFNDFFVSMAANRQGELTSDVHKAFYEMVGGLSAPVVAGNFAGYVGGLTANLAIALALYGDSSETPTKPRSRHAIMRKQLKDYYVGPLTSNLAFAQALYGVSSETPTEPRSEHAAAMRKQVQDSYKDQIAKQLKIDLGNLSPNDLVEAKMKAAAVPVGGGPLSFRDYQNMRTLKWVNAQIKNNQIPYFAPPEWEQLHRQLRALAYAWPDQLDKKRYTVSTGALHDLF